MTLASDAAFWLLLLSAPVCIWVAWSDMKHMRIPNLAVAVLVAAYAIGGILTLPLAEWGWRWLHLPVMLAVGAGLTAGGLVGAGDAKFAAGMAPFVAWHDLPFLTFLLATVLIVSFALHRLVRQIGWVRRQFPDWQSWRRDDFPMGLPLAGTLLAYLALAALEG